MRAKALSFYKQAFGAIESYLSDTGDESVIARPSVNDAEFWLSDDSPEFGNFSSETLHGGTVLAGPNLFYAFDKALKRRIPGGFVVLMSAKWRVEY